MALITPEGDSAIRVEFGNAIDEAVNRSVHRFCDAVTEADIHGVVECVAGYATATVYFEPLKLSYHLLQQRLATIATNKVSLARVTWTIDIPVVYGGEFGPDLARVAERGGLTSEQAVALHAEHPYLCYLVGFMPGFPYLGELPERLRTPRLSTPRTRVAAGSVGIADRQTGIYPRETPGGWNIIGRTPVVLYNDLVDPPVLIRAGDVVRFVPIDDAEYARIADAVSREEYAPVRKQGNHEQN